MGQDAGIEAPAAYLRHLEAQFADARDHLFQLEALGVIGAPGGTFMGLGIQKLAAIDPARLVDPDTEKGMFRNAGRAATRVPLCLLRAAGTTRQ